MSPQELLNSVNQQRIWGFLVGHERIGDQFLRPAWIGPDHKPSCKLGLKGGKVRFYDPPKQLNLDILDAYKLMRPGDSWDQTVEQILAWNGTSKSTAELLMSGDVRAPKFVLNPLIVEWTDWGKSYWASRGVDYSILSHKSIFTQEICGYEMHGSNDQGDFFQSQYARGFVYWCNDRPKLYFPEAPKERKFKGRLRADDVWLVKRGKYRESTGKPDTKTLLIAKSNKDLLVWIPFVSCDLMNVSAEGVFPSSEWLMTNVRMKYDRVVIVFDPDDAGVKGANELQNRLLSLSDIGTFVVKSWNWPDLETKDLDKFRTEYGHKETLKFLNRNGFNKIFE